MKLEGKLVTAIEGGTLPDVKPNGSAESTTIPNFCPVTSSMMVNFPTHPTGVNRFCG
ncbi:hypothetical protein M1D47_12370 [Bacillus sp. R1-10]